MSWDPVGLLLIAGLLAPVLAISAWCFAQERTPSREQDSADDVMTVAEIEVRLAREREKKRLTEADTVVLPVMRPAADDVVPPRTVPPRTVPAHRPPPPPGLSGVRMLPADGDLIRRVTEGLFQPPDL